MTNIHSLNRQGNSKTINGFGNPLILFSNPTASKSVSTFKEKQKAISTLSPILSITPVLLDPGFLDVSNCILDQVTRCSSCNGLEVSKTMMSANDRS